MKFLPILLALIMIACGQHTHKHEAESSVQSTSPETWRIASTQEWAKDAGLLNVESILFDPTHQVFYATNGLKYEAGTDGFIAKLSKDGQVLDLKWVEGLNRPTGMAIQDSLLYVADVNTLVQINTNTGTVLRRFPEPIAHSGLNDVAISPDGELFVSASFIHSVLRLNQETLEVWRTEEEKLAWANGLLAEDSRILVGGLNLCSISLDTKEITQLELQPLVKDFDGIAADGKGGYFLTTVENSGLFYVDGQNHSYQMKGEEVYFGDFAFDRDRKRLYIPRGNKSTAEFFISEFVLAQQAPAEDKNLP